MFEEGTCIKQFVDDHNSRLEQSTIEGYLIALQQLLCFCEKTYNEIMTQDIRNWLIHLETKQLKTSTIKQKIFGLRAFFQYCEEEEILKHNPMESIPLPKEEDKLPHYLTYEQLAQLRQLVEARLKQRAVIEVLYTTGVRVGEITNIRIEDIQWSERIINILNGKGKKERIVLFTKECGEYLNSYLQSRTDVLPYLFLNRHNTGPIGKGGIQHWFKIYREELGFYMTPHTLRHTFAAHLAMKGMSLSHIQVLLGHDSPQNTQIYARLHSHAQKQKYDEWM